MDLEPQHWVISNNNLQMIAKYVVVVLNLSVAFLSNRLLSIRVLRPLDK